MASPSMNIVIQDFKRVETAFDSLIRRVESATRASTSLVASLSQQITGQVNQLQSAVQQYSSVLSQLQTTQSNTGRRLSLSSDSWMLQQAGTMGTRAILERTASVMRDMSQAYGGYRSQQGQSYSVGAGAMSGALAGASTGMMLGGPAGAGVGAVIGGLGGAIWANYEMSLDRFKDSLSNATHALDGIGKRMGATSSLDELMNSTQSALDKTRLLAMSSRNVDALGNVTIAPENTMSGRIQQYQRVGAKVGLGLSPITDLALAMKDIGISNADDVTLQAIAQVQKSYGPQQALAYVKTMLAVDPQAGESIGRAREAARKALPIARAGFQIADLTPVDETVAAAQLVQAKALLPTEDPTKLQNLVYSAFATPGMKPGIIKTMIEHLASRGAQWMADPDAAKFAGKYGFNTKKRGGWSSGLTVADMFDTFTANLAEKYKAAPDEASREAITGQFFTDYMAAKLPRSAPLTRGIVAIAQRRAQGLTPLGYVAENAPSRVPLLSQTAPEYDIGYASSLGTTDAMLNDLLGIPNVAGQIERTDDPTKARRQTLAEMTSGLASESRTVVGEQYQAQEDQRLSAERTLQEQLARNTATLAEYTKTHDLFAQSVERAMQMLNGAIDVVTRDQLPRITATDVGRGAIK